MLWGGERHATLNWDFGECQPLPCAGAKRNVAAIPPTTRVRACRMTTRAEVGASQPYKADISVTFQDQAVFPSSGFAPLAPARAGCGSACINPASALVGRARRRVRFRLQGGAVPHRPDAPDRRPFELAQRPSSTWSRRRTDTAWRRRAWWRWATAWKPLAWRAPLRRPAAAGADAVRLRSAVHPTPAMQAIFTITFPFIPPPCMPFRFGSCMRLGQWTASALVCAYASCGRLWPAAGVGGPAGRAPT